MSYMSNSQLVDYIKISPNKTSPRKRKIDVVTIHCAVGQVTAETLGNIFARKSRKASSNYGIGYDGKIGMYVEEKDRSWCSSSSSNDNRAVTIEVASDMNAPYAITDAAYKSLIALLADICKRNEITELKWKADKSLIGQPDKQNMTVHRWFAPTDCPGKYLYDLHGQIASEVNAILGANETIYRVQTGAFRNKDYAIAMLNKVKKSGFSAYMVLIDGLYKIQVGTYKKKVNADAMVKKLEHSGFGACITTKCGSAVVETNTKTIDEIAAEVIQGKWGNGRDRKNRLIKAGYDYDTVQERVNKLLMK